MSESLQKPEILLSDLAKFSTPAQLHIGNMALHAFVEKHKKLPRAWNSEDAKEFTDIATDINSKSGEGCKVDDLDLKFLEKLANVAEGAFSPISAFMGGFIGQEVLKSVTGKFTPLKQWVQLPFYSPCKTYASFSCISMPLKYCLRNIPPQMIPFLLRDLQAKPLC